MTNEEAAVLCRYVRSLCPAQRFDEFTADVWHDLLYPFHLNEARTAAVAIASTQPFVSPGEIAAHVRRTRADRLHRHTDPTPKADPDNVAAYQAELRATRQAVATGREEPAQHELTAGPMHPDVAARLKTLGTYVPRQVDELLDEYRPVKAARRAALTANEPDALSVDCDWCQAPAGEPCRSRRVVPGGGATSNKRRTTPHPSRVDDAREAMTTEGADQCPEEQAAAAATAPPTPNSGPARSSSPSARTPSSAPPAASTGTTPAGPTPQPSASAANPAAPAAATSPSTNR